MKMPVLIGFPGRYACRSPPGAAYRPLSSKCNLNSVAFVNGKQVVITNREKMFARRGLSSESIVHGSNRTPVFIRELRGLRGISGLKTNVFFLTDNRFSTNVQRLLNFV